MIPGINVIQTLITEVRLIFRIGMLGREIFQKENELHNLKTLIKIYIKGILIYHFILESRNQCYD